MSRPFTLAVVGGGITGLAAAHRAQELAAEREIPVRPLLFEASARLGGNIRTEEVEGLVLETGPDQFLRAKPACIDLCRRLSLEHLLVDLDAGHAPLQVLRRGRPVALPDGLTVFGPRALAGLWRGDLLSIRGRLRVALERWVPPRGPDHEDESLGSFVRRRFGAEFLERVAEPVLAAIQTADAESMGLAVGLPRLLALERDHGSVTAALARAPAAPLSGGGFTALEPGMEHLVHALARRLPSGSVHTATRVERLTRDVRGGGLRAFVAGGAPVEADAVILACPAPVAGRLAGGLDIELGRRLAALDYASCATVHLAYAPDAPGRPLRGFGFFSGRAEGLPILACNYVHRKFPRRAGGDRVLLRAFLGGARDPHRLDDDDATLIDLAHGALARALELRERPLLARVHRYPASMPQYPVGHRACLRAIEARLPRVPGLFVAGGVTGAVGMPDCIATGEEAARQVVELAAAACAIEPRLDS